LEGRRRQDPLAEFFGVRREDLRVSVEGEVLHIRGVRRPPESREVQHLHQMEIAFGPFERSVRIGIAFERDQVSANLEDGYLSVTLPKRLPRSIEVER
jgi:HSP20 family protein